MRWRFDMRAFSDFGLRHPEDTRDCGSNGIAPQSAFRNPKSEILCRPRLGRPTAFTLVEILVVIAIIGMLVAILLPAVQAARESARRAACQNNLRQIGVALLSYHDVHKHFPIGCVEKRIPSTKPNGRQLAWSAALLPNLEEPSLWSQIDFESPYDSAANSTAAVTIVSVYLCPSTVRLASGREGAIVGNPASTGSGEYRGAAIDYGGIYGAAQISPSPNGVFLYDREVKISEITDGTSHTLALAEDTGRGWLTDGEWINGENIYDVSNLINTQQHNEIWSDHAGGAMALWCDGGVTLLAESMDLATLRASCTRAGNEVTSDVR
jgi:prepilin-type N-terminal cleavage/methylation domain-containing protein/prepilin-type processing-associated H-X9-DG protein